MENLEIYISYEKLRSKDLAYLLNKLSIISDNISKNYQNPHENERLNLRLGSPSLDILTINTGNSIKISFTEGWIPKISTGESNINISIPKKLGIPLFIGWLLCKGMISYQDFRNKQLDAQLKEIELQLKKSELRNIEDINKPNIQNEVKDTLTFILESTDLKEVKINDVQIKIQKK
ncbi:MAG: hypothetical protein LBT48_03710 [Prevotellaceae bacterium]|jgi:hypothetical protein|nr:hypothetical protein [Prevotellaceae bacterium]